MSGYIYLDTEFDRWYIATEDKIYHVPISSREGYIYDTNKTHFPGGCSNCREGIPGGIELLLRLEAVK